MLKFPKEIEFEVNGSLGDNYIICCKIHDMSMCYSKVTMHWGIDESLFDSIRSIYKVLPNIECKFSSESRPDNRIRGTFVCPHDLLGSGLKYGTERDQFVENTYGHAAHYPRFKFDDISDFDLPDKYTVICPQSGVTDGSGRMIPKNMFDDIIRNVDNPVLIGKKYNTKAKCINLIDKTTLSQAMSIVAKSTSLYGFQGLFCFISMSMGIPTTIYWKKLKRDFAGFKTRTHEKWNPFLKNVIQIEED